MEDITANHPSTRRTGNISQNDEESVRDPGSVLVCSIATQDPCIPNSNIKGVIVLVMGLLLSPVFCAFVAEGQSAAVKVTENSGLPQAVVLRVRGKCDYSEDGLTFATLKPYRVLSQGAIVRTGEGARADLFFRRMGTTVRLQSGTEVKLERMNRSMKDGAPVMETLIDLRSGRIFTVVRALIPGSTLEIRNAAGRSVVDGGEGMGRYIITADGTHVAEKNSAVPIKVVRETGVTLMIPPKR